MEDLCCKGCVFCFYLCLTSECHKRNCIGFGHWGQAKFHVCYFIYASDLHISDLDKDLTIFFCNDAVLICYFVVTFEGLLWKPRSDVRSNLSAKVHKTLFH